MGRQTWTKEQEEYLEQLYAQYIPLDEIVEKINLFSGINRTHTAISNKANKLGLTKKYIKSNNPNFKAIYQDYDWYYRHFVELGLNHEEMAKIANCTKRVIERWGQEKHHIDTYTRMHNKQLSTLQYNFIIGSLLGDGHIVKKEEHPLFVVSQSDNQKDYLYYKYDIMKDLCEMVPSKYDGKKQCLVAGCICDCQDFYRFNTRVYDAFRPFREMSKIDLVQQVNDYAFSIWMLDDGYCDEDGAWELCRPLDTQEERNLMINILKEKFNITARQKKDNRYYRFSVEDSVKITDIIMQNIPHNLDIIKYKILSKSKYQHYSEVM